jgi:AdoMet-dependent heme synthase
MPEPSDRGTTRPASTPAAAGPWPRQPLHHLDTLWIQVAGTLCNLTCTHCFVSCGPGDARHTLLSRGTVRERVAEGLALGVREVYFTGGEPFLHPELPAILADTLAVAPCTVLTNGTLFTDRRLAALAQLSAEARFSLEIRVSLDALGAPAHDAIRGDGTFARTLAGLRALEAHGLLPIVTVTQLADAPELAFREHAIARLREEGLVRPRLKVLPLFRIGREPARTHGYAPGDSLAGLGEAFDPHRLQCGNCRAVTSRGVFVCPLLVDEPDGRMGDTLAEALGPFELRHGACFTCWVSGMTCANG